MAAIVADVEEVWFLVWNVQLFVTEYIYIIPENISFVKGENSEIHS